MLDATFQRTADTLRAAPTPDDRSGDGVRGGNRKAQIDGAEQRDGTAGLGAS
jgi:hypothetical protein